MSAWGQERAGFGSARECLLCPDTVEKVGLTPAGQKFSAIQCVQQFLAEGVYGRWLGLQAKPWLRQTTRQ